MRQRAIIHLGGPEGAGKTTFIEALLRAEVGLAICIRAERDENFRRPQESSPQSHAELRRYREAGASAVALYRFSERDGDSFFTSRIMQDYSEVVLIEGDQPIDGFDLSVFVTPCPSPGVSLLTKVKRDRFAAHRQTIETLKETYTLGRERPEMLMKLLGLDAEQSLLKEAFLQQSRFADPLLRILKQQLDEMVHVAPTEPTEHWAITPGYAGIERAQLVIVSVREGEDRLSAEALLEDVVRLRKDKEVCRDVIGAFGNKRPVTAVVADLANAKDEGSKKAVARVKRAVRQQRIT